MKTKKHYCQKTTHLFIYNTSHVMLRDNITC